jgi:Trk-type K+ transport system membrane component
VRLSWVKEKSSGGRSITSSYKLYITTIIALVIIVMGNKIIIIINFLCKIQRRISKPKSKISKTTKRRMTCTLLLLIIIMIVRTT